jgi:hypothetical protein
MATPQPYPSRDPVVETKGPNQGYVSFEWDKWFQGLSGQVAASPAVVPSGLISALSQTASIALTPVGSTQVAGIYRVDLYTQVKTVAGVASSTQVGLSWTYNGVVQIWTGTLMNGNLTTTNQPESVVIAIDAGGPISYQVTYASNPASAMVYDFYLALELIGNL